MQAKLRDVSSRNQPVPGPYLALKGFLRGLMHKVILKEPIAVRCLRSHVHKVILGEPIAIMCWRSLMHKVILGTP